MDITILNCPQGQPKGAVNKITRSKGLKKRVGFHADPFLENSLNLDGETVRQYSSWKKGRSEVYGVAASAAAASTRPAPVASAPQLKTSETPLGPRTVREPGASGMADPSRMSSA